MIPSTIAFTGTCFDDVFDLLGDLSGGAISLHDLTVVHGLVRAGQTGEAFAHGWVEHDNAKRFDARLPDRVVWQSGIAADQSRLHFATPLDDFDRAHRTIRDRCVRYPANLALAILHATDYTGPWRSELRALAEAVDKAGTAGVIRGVVQGAAPCAIFYPGAWAR